MTSNEHIINKDDYANPFESMFFPYQTDARGSPVVREDIVIRSSKL